MPVTYPLPPLNATVVSPLVRGAFDVRWDDPSLQAGNAAWVVVGVNVYRSDASDRGPYRRLNAAPVGSTVYRDATYLERVVGEPVDWETGWAARGLGPHYAQWIIRTRFPLYKPHDPAGVYANAPGDARVLIGGQAARVVGVFGSTREVTVDPAVLLNPLNERWSPGPLPDGPSTPVTVDYYTLRNLVGAGVDKRSFYRVTTVAYAATDPDLLVETPLAYVAPVSDGQIETVDYIWREAQRRNRWILEQGGERVKLYVQKVGGALCSCGREVNPVRRELQGQPSSRCVECYGTGFVGGYEGPYDILLAPDDGEKRISQTPTGRRKEHQYEVWTGATPIISQRDFIVKQNNDRYSVGPVRRPSNRGNVLQQHFQVQYLDADDIRYRIPIDPALASPYLPWPETRYSPNPVRETYDRREDAPWPTGPDAVTPMVSNDPGQSTSQERARTGAGENILR